MTIYETVPFSIHGRKAEEIEIAVRNLVKSISFVKYVVTSQPIRIFPDLWEVIIYLGVLSNEKPKVLKTQINWKWRLIEFTEKTKICNARVTWFNYLPSIYGDAVNIIHSTTTGNYYVYSCGRETRGIIETVFDSPKLNIYE